MQARDKFLGLPPAPHFYVDVINVWSLMEYLIHYAEFEICEQPYFM